MRVSGRSPDVRTSSGAERILYCRAFLGFGVSQFEFFFSRFFSAAPCNVSCAVSARESGEGWLWGWDGLPGVRLAKAGGLEVINPLEKFV
jgi:hypothetical protein